MKAVLLAAGKGKRMGALTERLPKPMVEVHGKPVLEHILTGLRDHTPIRDFFIITGHCAEVIESYFGDGSKFGVRCSYGRQEIPDGTGKAPEIAKAWAGSDPFLLSYGDILIQPQGYAALLAAFEGHDGALSVKGGQELAKGGAVVFDENFLLSDLIEKAEPGTVSTPWYNAGIYVFDPRLFDYTGVLQKSARGEYELTDAIRAMAKAGLRIKGYELPGEWADVRDPQVLQELNQRA